MTIEALLDQIHPELRPLVDKLLASRTPLEGRDPIVFRALLDTSALDGSRPTPTDLEICDLVIELPGRHIRARLYRPKDVAGDLPLLLYFHGGGWMIGNIDTHSDYVCELTRTSGVAFLSVDYRLAPEHPYPACIDDAYEALLWAHRHAGSLGIDPARIGVSGDSTGAQIATACTFMVRDRGGPALSFQLLVYPLTDCDFSRPSYAAYDGLLLYPDYLRWFWTYWYGFDLPKGDPLAVPMQQPDLGGLPPAHIVTCEYDILRDEGEAYAERLSEAGVATTLRRVPGVTQPFFRAMAVSPYIRAETAEMGRRVREAMRGA